MLSLDQSATEDVTDVLKFAKNMHPPAPIFAWFPAKLGLNTWVSLMPQFTTQLADIQTHEASINSEQGDQAMR